MPFKTKITCIGAGYVGGPTMAVIGRSKVRRVFWAKDLNPWISNAFRYMLSPRRMIQVWSAESACRAAACSACFFV